MQHFQDSSPHWSPKDALRGPLGPSKGSREDPRGHQEGLRRTQKIPRGGREDPRRTQKIPRGRLGGPTRPLRRPQGTPGRHWETPEGPKELLRDPRGPRNVKIVRGHMRNHNTKPRWTNTRQSKPAQITSATCSPITSMRMYSTPPKQIRNSRKPKSNSALKATTVNCRRLNANKVRSARCCRMAAMQS